MNLRLENSYCNFNDHLKLKTLVENYWIVQSIDFNNPIKYPVYITCLNNENI